MSRSKKKAIVKDKGHMKNVYWKIHRRVNKQINKHFFTSAKCPSPHYWLSSYDEMYQYDLREHIGMGIGNETAVRILEEDYEFEWPFGRIAGNLYRSWWEEPKFKLPKELINDYGYSDYTFDYEHVRRRKGYFYPHENDQFSNEWYNKKIEFARTMRRK